MEPKQSGARESVPAMTGGAQATLLPNGRRLHLHHGPIDIVAEAVGAAEEVQLAYRQAAARFATQATRESASRVAAPRL